MNYSIGFFVYINQGILYLSCSNEKFADARRQKEYSPSEDIFYSIIQTPNAIRILTLSFLTPLTLHLITFNLPYAVSSEEAS
jgi:hypothetical protein